jgi:hypothetical protein
MIAPAVVAKGRALDLDMFNNEAPYKLILRLKNAACIVPGACLVEGGYIAFENTAVADDVAKHVNASLPPEATIRLSGVALWDLAQFGEE